MNKLRDSLWRCQIGEREREGEGEGRGEEREVNRKEEVPEFSLMNFLNSFPTCPTNEDRERKRSGGGALIQKLMMEVMRINETKRRVKGRKKRKWRGKE